MVNFAKPHRIQINLQNKAVIVERVHRVCAVGEDLGDSFAFEGHASEREIFFRILQFGE